MTMDMGDLLQPVRNTEYTYRVPTPPRIVVPPPNLGANALPDFRLSALHDSGFLRNVDYNEVVKSNCLTDWTYERRREAQMILPFLYLGPMVAVKDRAFLRNQGITMVLGIRQRHSFESKLMDGTLKIADELGIQRQTIDLINNQHLIRSFPDVTRIVNEHLTRVQQLQQNGSVHAPSMGKVLIFCESGNERSAGAVAAYLMEMHKDVDHVKAMQLCQAQRFCVNFDDGMKRLLQGYWDILCAKRDVGAGAVANGGNESLFFAPRASSKRTLEVDDEAEDMDLGDDHGDSARFLERRSFTPFTDRA